jgi:predicted hydrocarbon binding protein
MHGVVFGEMERFVAEKYGQEQWTALLNKAGLDNRIYLAMNEYPDAEIVALVTSAAEMTGLESGAVLESFGEFIAPALIKLYGHLLKPTWRTLDVIGNTERAVHTVVRVKNPGARPPLLKTQRQSEDCVVLIYHSARKMCSFAIGIARGLAKHFREEISVHETECMNKGASSCVIVFRKMGERANS